MDWISVEDRLPDFDEFVLWYIDSGNMFIDFIDKDLDIKLFLSASYNKGKVETITHWTSLPEPPKQ
jgi:hypothetical protein